MEKRGLGQGKGEGESQAPTSGEGCLQIAAMGPCDAQAQGKAKAHSATHPGPGIVTAEKGCEQARKLILGNPRALVRDHQAGLALGL